MPKPSVRLAVAIAALGLAPLAIVACSSDGETVTSSAGHGPSVGGSTTTTTTTSVCVPTSPVAECQSDADCDDGDKATVDHCQLQENKEFPLGTCVHDACDGGPDCVKEAVDPTCGVAENKVVYPPFVPLKAPDVPASCSNGFEACDAKVSSNIVYVVDTTAAAGSRAITLDLDFATYTAPDGLVITGVDAQCKQYLLFDSCRLKTADLVENQYTDGKHRPKDEAIRQYKVPVRKGTKQLTFDFSRVTTPMYVRALGLCDFDLRSPAKSDFKWWAPVD